MHVTNIHEAKTQLSRLVERAAAGEEIIIGKAGRPVAWPVKYQEPAKPSRKPGSMKGLIRIFPDFDEADKEIETLFYGESIDHEEPPARHPRSAVVARRK